MSARTYNLRARTGAVAAAPEAQDLGLPPSESIESSPDTANPSNVAEPPSIEVPAFESEPTVVVRSYSDVVASRPPSPSRERHILPSKNPVEDPENTRVPPAYRQYNEETVVENNYIQNAELSSSVNSENSEEADSLWTTVKRRRAQGRGPLRNKQFLTSEQARLVERAAKGMTVEQKRRIRQRQEKLKVRRPSSVSSRGEGPSRPKGKGIDPREWGNVNISRESLDVEAQAAALQSFRDKKSTKEEHNRKRKYGGQERRTKRHGSSRKTPKRSERPAEYQPSAQIAPGSYLGAALRAAGRSRGSQAPHEYPSDSSSSSSSSHSSRSSSGSSNGSPSSHRSDESERSRPYNKRRRDNRHG